MSALLSLTKRQRFWHQHLQQTHDQQVRLTDQSVLPAVHGAAG